MMNLILLLSILIAQISCKPAARDSEEASAMVTTSRGSDKEEYHLWMEGEDKLLVNRSTFNAEKGEGSNYNTRATFWGCASYFVFEALGKEKNAEALRYFAFDQDRINGKEEIQKILKSKDQISFYRRDLSVGSERAWEFVISRIPGKKIQDFITNKKEKTIIFQKLGEYVFKYGSNNIEGKISQTCKILLDGDVKAPCIELGKSYPDGVRIEGRKCVDGKWR